MYMYIYTYNTCIHSTASLNFHNHKLFLCGLCPIGQAQEVFVKQNVDFMKDVVDTGVFFSTVLSVYMCVVDDDPHYMWAVVCFLTPV